MNFFRKDAGKLFAILAAVLGSESHFNPCRGDSNRLNRSLDIQAARLDSGPSSLLASGT